MAINFNDYFVTFGATRCSVPFSNVRVNPERCIKTLIRSIFPTTDAWTSGSRSSRIRSRKRAGIFFSIHSLNWTTFNVYSQEKNEPFPSGLWSVIKFCWLACRDYPRKLPVSTSAFQSFLSQCVPVSRNYFRSQAPKSPRLAAAVELKFDEYIKRSKATATVCKANLHGWIFRFSAPSTTGSRRSKRDRTEAYGNFLPLGGKVSRKSNQMHKYFTVRSWEEELHPAASMRCCSIVPKRSKVHSRRWRVVRVLLNYAPRGKGWEKFLTVWHSVRDCWRTLWLHAGCCQQWWFCSILRLHWQTCCDGFVFIALCTLVYSVLGTGVCKCQQCWMLWQDDKVLTNVIGFVSMRSSTSFNQFALGNGDDI